MSCEQFEIKDCKFCNITTTNRICFWEISGSPNFEYLNEGEKAHFECYVKKIVMDTMEKNKKDD